MLRYFYSFFLIFFCICLQERLNPLGETESDSTPINNLEKVQNYIGIIPNAVKKTAMWFLDKFNGIQSEFDAREKWPMCTIIGETMLYKNKLENSWATVISSVLADRICIAQGEQFNEHLSIAELLSCCDDCGTSNGRFINKSWEYYKVYGAFSEPHFIKSGVCPPKESVIDPKYRRKISKVYTLNSIYEIKKDILTYGPVSASLKLYGSKNQAIDTRFDTVKIIGWGIKDDIPYWLCLQLIANSWNALSPLEMNMGPPDPNFEGTVIVGQPTSFRKNSIWNTIVSTWNNKIYGLPKEIDINIKNDFPKDIPPYFDATNVWPMCTTIGETTVSETQTKSLWAVVTSSAFADRICIAQDGQFNEHLSITELLACCHDCDAQGKSEMSKIEKAWEYFRDFGAFSEQHYKQYYGECPSGKSIIDHLKFRWKISHVYTLNNVNEIKKDILTYGPVAAVLSSKKNPKIYLKSNYDTQEYFLKPYKIIGWVMEDDIPHWLCLDTRGSNLWNAIEPLKFPMELSDPNVGGIVIAGKPIVKE